MLRFQSLVQGLGLRFQGLGFARRSRYEDALHTARKAVP